MEKAGREGDHTIFYWFFVFFLLLKLKRCDLAQTGTEIKYTSGVKFSDPKLAKATQISKISFLKKDRIVCGGFLF